MFWVLVALHPVTKSVTVREAVSMPVPDHVTAGLVLVEVAGVALEKDQEYATPESVVGLNVMGVPMLTVPGA
jgi:hypothetical protein